MQTSLYDVRFTSDSYFHRACKLVSFGIFTGFAIVGPTFDTSRAAHDAKAFKAMSLILMVSSVRRQPNRTVRGGRLCSVPTKEVPCTVGTTVPMVQTMVQVRYKEE